VWSIPGEAVLNLEKQPGACCVVHLGLVSWGATAEQAAMLMQGPGCPVSPVGWESCQHQRYSWQSKGEVVTGVGG